MGVQYSFHARTADGRDIWAVYTSETFISPDEGHLALFPGSPDFSSGGCRGFHFWQQRTASMIQYDDPASGRALSYGFVRGAYHQFGLFDALDVGFGRGTLEISDTRPPRTVVLATTMEQSSNLRWRFPTGATLEQLFKAAETGEPTELGVKMGNGQNPFSVWLRIFIHDRLIFERDYIGLRQRTTDWAVVFDLTGLNATVQVGDWIKVCLTPDTEIGIEPVFSQNPDIPQTRSPHYRSMAARFFLNGLTG